jgi:hypothetical protein
MPYIPNSVISGGPPGSQGVPGAAGISTATTLAGSTIANATSFSVASVPALLTEGAVISIDVGTVECETRRVTNIVSTTVTVSPALVFAHALGDSAVVVPGDEVPLTYYGAAGDNSTDDRAAIQAALDDLAVKAPGMWLTGQGRMYVIDGPVWGISNNTRLRNLQQLTAKSTFSPVRSDMAMLMSGHGNKVTFTATAATDKLSAAGLDIGGDGNTVIFTGGSLPGNLSALTLYYVRDFVSVTDFKVSATYGGSAVDISSDGGGTIYSKVGWIHTTRMYLEDVYVYGNSVTSINGIWAALQQPGYWIKVRADFCPGVGITISGTQQHEFFDTECINNGVGMEITNNSSMCHFFSLNIELCTTGLKCSLGTYASTGTYGCEFYGLHTENNTTHVDITHGLGHLFNGWISMNSGATGISVNSADPGGSGYTIQMLRFYAIDTDDNAISDTTTGRAGAPITIKQADLTTGQFLYDYTQPDGYDRPAIWGTTRPKKILSGTTTVDQGSISAGAVGTFTITVTGAVTTDTAVASPSGGIDAGLVWSAYVSSANTVTVVLANVTASPIDPANRTWRALVGAY